jgi:hypothetical protein
MSVAACGASGRAGCRCSTCVAPGWRMSSVSGWNGSPVLAREPMASRGAPESWAPPE